MKAITTFLLTGIILSITVCTSKAQELAPDQNPNYKKSLERYMKKSDSLVLLQGTTVQETYRAIDWMEMKAQQKALRKERRYNVRMARNRNNFCPFWTSSYYPNYGGYGLYNNWYGPSPYFGYSNPGPSLGFYGYPNVGNSILGLGLLGLGIYSLFD